ncbi:PQQ-like beta-propeller repeat protein [Streptomyces sp. SCSIO ZS0520]|uniref:PQQ-like beta-propeller repeat protein n=1 Tax=Streptomyces sp. SCSIO ZS0520 TaxID=2892996 RepID=UPI0021D7FCD0|nr:PQQ-like beta-propeller repeat protein [Streptomyces sp. SCSIO ZS0520]
MGLGHPRPYGGRRASRSTAALLLALGMCAASACTGGGDEGRDEPPAAREPAGWHPWGTAFEGGGRDTGPGEENACAEGTDPGNALDEERIATRGRTGDPETLNCSGTGFRDERLRVRDGAYIPEDSDRPDQPDRSDRSDQSEEGEPDSGGSGGSGGSGAEGPGAETYHPEKSGSDRAADFGRARGMVFLDEETDPTGPGNTSQALGGQRLVRALDEKSREQRWRHRIRSAAVLHGDTVVGDEATKITNRPKDHNYEDWTPLYRPGGALVAWDPRSGEEKWRVPVPKGRWCEPARVGGKLFASCADSQYDRGKTTWYRVDTAARKLHALYTHPTEQERVPDMVGADEGDLVFLPPGKVVFPDRDYPKIVRVDMRTGKQRTVPLPDSLAPGAEPRLREGDLYFSRDRGRELSAVDATTGEQRWQRRTSMTYPSEPVVSARRGEVYLADSAGRLLALGREDGEERWRTREPRAKDGGTTPREMDAVSSLTLARDVLVVSTGNTVFSVSPDSPETRPKTWRTVRAA